ncbi:hypothetical protein AKJ09_06087 [Labilithrix luteola]|uniref:Uncharacterized protein n=1 Tax=Labilithrix luteola TaxID=1391654 RepID=A0A0K1Q0W0_9BACT|nr:hypothetical protein AKJ09_06087 [Labilithrix luteola]
MLAHIVHLAAATPRLCEGRQTSIATQEALLRGDDFVP